MLIDTHAHLQVRQFDGDREAVISAARAAQVDLMVVPGIDLESSRSAVELAASHAGEVFAAVGIHPHDATTFSGEALAVLQELTAAPGVVAIGEIGLDYYRHLSPAEVQRDSLVRQLALAGAVHLPVILHNRDSHADLIAILREHKEDLSSGGVFHCFIGDRQMAEDALDLGFYLSFAGPVTFPRNTELAEVAAWAPSDRILIETDSPYLAPPPFRGKRNEPGHVRLIAEHIAKLRGITLAELAALTTRNAEVLFRLPASQPEKGNPTHASFQHP
jgi:TatD DNase family protein